MERGEWNEDEGSSDQNKLFKQFQAKTKLNLSLNLGSRETAEKKERGMWMFKRKKKRHVLDGVISLSQPDLLCSAPVGLDGEESPLCGKVNPSSGYSRNISQAGAKRMQSDAQTPISSMESKTPAVAYLVQSHHKSSSLGSACLERLSDEPAARNQAVALEEDDQLQGMGAHGASGVNSQRALPTSTMYKLDIDLKRGNNLAIRDRGGTSDPYVKFKLCGKEVFRSRIIHKNLNPVWDESTTLFVENLHESLYVKVFDYDFGLQDDFIGSAYLYMESLEHHRTQPVILNLTDPHHPDQDLGTLELDVTLTPKDGPLEEQKDATRQDTQRLSEVHRKAQLWRGIVSISLIEGRDLVPMDPNGLSDPYAKFRLGPQKYKSKTMPKTLRALTASKEFPESPGPISMD
ncbi:LOW QUALITY PROTEIN: multiple C2 and transmembrane domain-containing protein 1 [Osmerus eperlanus]|uniref:LOW QUALITY PROTEIN: multiple C2 and transmembrane domain-containing protein 1 n=1 Tax=Osmerus eperlanus TaxID=29151 RepID=UPI002E134B4D